MDEQRIRELIARWDDPWKPTRNEAAELLAQAGEVVLPHLRALLLADHPDPDHAQYALWVLDRLGTPEAEALAEAYWARH